MISTNGTKRLITGFVGLGLIAAACSAGDADANPAPPAEASTTTEGPEATPSLASSTTTVETDNPTTTTTTTTTTIVDSQDTPQINEWRLDAESVRCEESDLPGSAGGEATLPAVWAAGNADFVNFVVDGDRRPANVAREVSGPGNIQVPCDPTLNDGHEITLVAYTGSPGDPVAETASETLIVITTATKDN